MFFALSNQLNRNFSNRTNFERIPIWHVLGVQSNWNLFKICSILKFEIRLIWKSKRYPKNLMKISSKLVRFDAIYRVESNFSDAGFVRNSFHSIRKFMIRLIRKVKNNLKNSIKINSKFVRFDSKIYNWIDSKDEK